MVNRIKKSGDGLGARPPGNYEDLLAAGVVDPAKVTRFALQNAASMPLVLTTGRVMVAEKPEKNPPPMPGGGGGGMPGGMGGMS